MIFDGENMFFDKKTLTSGTIESATINLGVGESYAPMFLVAMVANGTGENPKATITLQTSATEDFKNAVTLGTYSTLPLNQPMPRGNLGYVRLSVASTYTGGTMTAGLVLDDDIKHRD